MAIKTIETRAKITAEDRTGATFASVAQKLRGMEGAAAAASRRMDGLARGMSAVGSSRLMHEDIARRMSSISATVAAAAPVARAASSHGRSIAAVTERAAETALVAGSTAAAITPFVMKIAKDASLRATENLRMQFAGMTADEIKQTNAEAQRLAGEYKPVGQTTIGKMVTDARTIAGSTKEALSFMDTILKFRVLLQSLNKNMGEEQIDEEMQKLIRAGDLMGATKNRGKFDTFLEGTGRAMNVFGDSVRPSDFFAAAQHAGAAATQWEDEFVSGVLPSLIQTMGGDATGTALGTLSSAVVGGRMKVKSAKVLNELGLIDRKKIVRNKQGDVVGVMPGGFKGGDLEQRNPFKYATQVIAPALARKGITAPDKMMETISSAFSDRRAGAVMTHLILNREQVERDIKMSKGGMGLTPTATKLMKEDLPTATKGLTEQFNALSATLGRDLTPKLVSFTNSLSDKLRDYEKKISGDPKEHTRALIGGGLASIAATHLGLSALGGYFGGPGVTASLGAFTRTMGPIALAADAAAFGYKMLENYRTLSGMLDETDKLFQLPKPVAAMTAATKAERSGMLNFGLGGAVMQQAPVARLEGAASINMRVTIDPSQYFLAKVEQTTSATGALSADTGVTMAPGR